MRHISWIRATALSCLIVAICFSARAQDKSASSPPDGLPDLAALKALPYRNTTPPSAGASPSYQDLTTIVRLGHAYAQGKQVLPNYHEPVPTRGPSGIAIFKSVSPSVVLVIVGDVKDEKFEASGLGAGVILNPAGDILTNWHVIDGHGGALIFLKPKGSAEMQDSNSYVAMLVAQDETTDLALLRIVKPPANLPSVRIGSISSVQVAEDIHVIGHPHGNLWSYSTGVVSQVRDGYDWTYEDGSKHEAKVLQLQTAINPGNSGGPVLDDQGKLLGLVAMIEEGQNIDYAIASDVIQSFLSEAASLKTRGSIVEQKSPDAVVSTTSLQGGRSVLRASYPGLVEYLILDKDANPIALKAEIEDGTQLAAWNPNSFGGFSQWTISFRDGSSVRAHGSASIPDIFNSD